MIVFRNAGSGSPRDAVASGASGGNLIGAALAQPAARNTCHGDSTALRNLSASRGNAIVAAEFLEAASPMREGRLIYALY